MAHALMAKRPPSLTAEFGSFVTRYPVAFFIAACVLVVDTLYAPYRFADYNQYLVLTDGLYYFAQGKWLNFEAGSNLLFLGSRIVTGNTIRAVNLAHYVLGGAYVYFVFRLAHWNDVGWRGLLISFAFFGSLLAFVTIRATPAYMLVTLAALDVTKGRNRAIVLTLAASMFHVSALLAVVPIIVGLLQNRLRSLRWIERSTRSVFIVAVAVLATFGAMRALVGTALTNIVAQIPFLNKYDVYTASLDPQNTVAQNGGVSANHLIYAVLMSVFVTAFTAMPDERCRRMRLYVITSYFLFLILEFAPVTAYRQSQFWVIPAMLVFPWQRFVPAGFRAILFAGGCVALFLLALRGVVA